MSDARQTPPSFDELVSMIKKLFTDYLEDYVKAKPSEIKKSWERYKTLNHLYRDDYLDESAAGREDAVEFAEWILKNNIEQTLNDKGKLWVDFQLPRGSNKFTTAQLYELFKQQKEK